MTGKPDICDVLEAIHKSLHPLAEFTDALSSEKYASVSFVKSVLHLFNSSILKVEDDDVDLRRAMKTWITSTTSVLDYLNEKYSDPLTQELLDTASAVDPRFKLRFVTEDSVAEVMDGPPDPQVETTETAEEAPCAKKKTIGSFLKVLRTRPDRTYQRNKV
ncbi:uncharacterized protein ACJ7VT_006017 [Polymixia lowei]